MAKKISFDNLPAAVEKILEILTAEESEHAALPELVRRTNILEKKLDYLQKTLSPETAVMDMQTVCRILKLRPKAVKELADSGELPYRTEGRRILFYEDGVVRFFMTRPLWSAAAKSVAAAGVSGGSETSDPADGQHRRIDINEACTILERSAAAIYQLSSNDRVPHHKEGRKTYFYADELREWAKNNPPQRRRSRIK